MALVNHSDVIANFLSIWFGTRFWTRDWFVRVDSYFCVSVLAYMILYIYILYVNIIYAKIVLAGVEQGAQLVSLVSNKGLLIAKR